MSVDFQLFDFRFERLPRYSQLGIGAGCTPDHALGSPQSVLVLGGTSDIARCLLRVLVSRRTRTVVLAGRDPARLKEAADELQSLGADRVETLPFEATDTAGHQALVDDVFARHGEIDLVLFAFGTLGRSGGAGWGGGVPGLARKRLRPRSLAGGGRRLDGPVAI